MNLTSLQHLAAALIMQGLIGILMGDWWAGAAAGSFFFLGREHAQAEYRWIERFGSGCRANLPWWGAVDPRVWGHLDSWLDWIVPTMAVLVVAVVAAFFN